MLPDAQDEGGIAFVAGIHYALQFMFALQKTVGFINHEGWLQLLDRAEEGWGADVGRDDWPIDQLKENGQQGGLAAAPARRLDADVGTDIAQLKGIGVQDPQSYSLRRPLGQYDEKTEELDQSVEQRFGIDGFGPGRYVAEPTRRKNDAGFWRCGLD